MHFINLGRGAETGGGAGCGATHRNTISGFDAVTPGGGVRNNQEVNILARVVHELMGNTGGNFQALAFR